MPLKRHANFGRIIENTIRIITSWLQAFESILQALTESRMSIPVLFFGAMGMAIFCSVAAYALRTRKEEEQEGDQLIDEGADKDVRFIGEVTESRQVRGVRKRAEERRKEGIRRFRL